MITMITVSWKVFLRRYKNQAVTPWFVGFGIPLVHSFSLPYTARDFNTIRLLADLWLCPMLSVPTSALPLLLTLYELAIGPILNTGHFTHGV